MKNVYVSVCASNNVLCMVYLSVSVTLLAERKTSFYTIGASLINVNRKYTECEHKLKNYRTVNINKHNGVEA